MANYVLPVSQGDIVTLFVFITRNKSKGKEITFARSKREKQQIFTFEKLQQKKMSGTVSTR